MTVRLLRTAIIIAFILSAKGALAATTATTHYISKSLGTDTNSGTTKSTPWAHFPGMPGCASTCASYAPVAGDQFILRGGDTWTASDFGGTNFNNNGTSASPIYIGVDNTWFSGSSWARPIWNCQNTSCGGGTIVKIFGNYVTLDNIEITGYQYNGGGHIIQTGGNFDTVSNMYLHGWSHVAGSCGSGTNDPYAITMYWSGFNGEGTGTVYSQNVIDGSDSGDIGGNYCFGGILHGSTVKDNVIRYVYNGMNGIFSVIDGNLVEHNNVSTTGDHCNMIYPQDIFQGSVLQISNNVVRHAACPGGTTIFVMANSSCPSCTSYMYNNVLYDNDVDSDPGFSIGGPNANGIFYYYNNTVVTSGFCMQNGSAGTGTAFYENFHCISSSSGICHFANGICTSSGGNLLQTPAQADANSAPHFDQYTSSATYPYSATASTNSTVGAGNNLTSLCSGAFSVLCNDSSYATYNTTNHTAVVRTVIGRIAGGWDIGAYQFSSSQSQLPQPPTSLQVAVQ